MTKGASVRVARIGRREAIGRLAGAGAGLASVLRRRHALAASLSQDPAGAGGHPAIPTWQRELRQLAPNVYAYIQEGAPGMNNASLSNAGVVVGPQDMLAIDTLGPPIHAKAFLAAATKATGKRFGRVVNTHHHRDHRNGNCFFLPAEIVSHPYCREAVIETGIPERPYPDRPQWQEGMNELKLAPPVTTFRGSMTYYYGDIIVELMPVAPAHTYGDVMAFLAQHRILFAGDVAFFYVAPVSVGHVSNWIETLQRIQGTDVETIVPGHGPIGTKKEIAEYLSLVKREARRRFDAGISPGRAAAEMDLGRFENWLNRERIVSTVVRLYAEFNGTIGPNVDSEILRKAGEEYTALRGPQTR